MEGLRVPFVLPLSLGVWNNHILGSNLPELVLPVIQSVPGARSTWGRRIGGGPDVGVRDRVIKLGPGFEGVLSSTRPRRPLNEDGLR